MEGRFESVDLSRVQQQAIFTIYTFPHVFCTPFGVRHGKRRLQLPGASSRIYENPHAEQSIRVYKGTTSGGNFLEGPLFFFERGSKSYLCKMSPRGAQQQAIFHDLYVFPIDFAIFCSPFGARHGKKRLQMPGELSLNYSQ